MITVSFVFLDGQDCCLSELLCCYVSAAGLVERVVILGAPISIQDESWEVARKVVGWLLQSLDWFLVQAVCTASVFQEV